MNAASAPGPSAAGAYLRECLGDFNDAVMMPAEDGPAEHPAGIPSDGTVAIDRSAIATFLDVVFGYCEGLIPVRGFVDVGQGRETRPHNIWIPADNTAPDLLATYATWAAREGTAVYVIPGTVAEHGQARAEHVLQIQAVVVDLDAGDVEAKFARLLRHLGPPTLLVESGGRTAEGAAKLHAWWRLTEPAEGADLVRLCALRGEIGDKVGGDAHFRSAHQPIRVPGTVYRKHGAQRVVAIRDHNPRREIDLAAFADAVASMPPFLGAGTHSAPTDSASPGHKPGIDAVLTTPVREGAQDDWTRFQGASAAIGHFVRMVHDGRLTAISEVDPIGWTGIGVT